MSPEKPARVRSLFADISEDDRFVTVHSEYLICTDPLLVASTRLLPSFCSAQHPFFISARRVRRGHRSRACRPTPGTSPTIRFGAEVTAAGTRHVRTRVLPSHSLRVPGTGRHVVSVSISISPLTAAARCAHSRRVGRHDRFYRRRQRRLYIIHICIILYIIYIYLYYTVDNTLVVCPHSIGVYGK